jgi:hypothetical protein
MPKLPALLRHANIISSWFCYVKILVEPMDQINPARKRCEAKGLDRSLEGLASSVSFANEAEEIVASQKM